MKNYLNNLWIIKPPSDYCSVDSVIAALEFKTTEIAERSVFFLYNVAIMTKWRESQFCFWKSSELDGAWSRPTQLPVHLHWGRTSLLPFSWIHLLVFVKSASVMRMDDALLSLALHLVFTSWTWAGVRIRKPPVGAARLKQEVLYLCLHIFRHSACRPQPPPCSEEDTW